jgi:DNA polymerase-3 subunit chi
MTDRVDFYVLKSTVAKLRWTFACRLTEKAYLRDLSVVILNDSAADTEIMDELLWTFNERSFVPHAVHRPGTTLDASSPVNLTGDLAGVERADLLVNLGGRVPDGLERFNRIAEVIDADEERRRRGRERFKAYRDLKLTLETHQLDDAADA